MAQHLQIFFRIDQIFSSSPAVSCCKHLQAFECSPSLYTYFLFSLLASFRHNSKKGTRSVCLSQIIGVIVEYELFMIRIYFVWTTNRVVPSRMHWIAASNSSKGFPQCFGEREQCKTLQSIFWTCGMKTAGGVRT